MTTRTQLVMLGTGTPRPDAKRAQSGLAVVVDDQPYLVDFGAGIVQRAVQADQQGVHALKTQNLTRAFVTHLHADHTAGYPDLILSPWIHERENPLRVYGPAGLQGMTEHILAAYQISNAEHRAAHPTTAHGLTVEVHEIDAGKIYQDERVTVTAFPADHGALTAFGYRFDTPDGSIVISGDTRPTDTLIEQGRGCHVLVHEVYSVKGLQSHSAEWQAYHQRVHTSSHELGKIAAEIKPGLLVLYHQLLWTAKEADLLGEIKDYYDGAVIFAHDLDVFQLSNG